MGAWLDWLVALAPGVAHHVTQHARPPGALPQAIESDRFRLPPLPSAFTLIDTVLGVPLPCGRGLERAVAVCCYSDSGRSQRSAPLRSRLGTGRCRLPLAVTQSVAVLSVLSVPSAYSALRSVAVAVCRYPD